MADDLTGTPPSAGTAEGRYAAAVAQVRSATSGCPVVVFDLDGVVREFDNAQLDAMDAALGLGDQGFLRTAFEHEVLIQVVTGRITFAQWSEEMATRLGNAGAAAEAVARVMEIWHGHRGRPVEETVALIAEIRTEGRRTFLFTNGTDNVPAELEQLGLGHLLDGLLNSADFGVAKPAEEAYAAAHQRIEQHLGRPVPRQDVAFVDDREDNVAGAEAFGWRAVHFHVET
jgi:putative hydrolase of the HAD superfamily